jgi:hypothetical protein
MELARRPGHREKSEQGGDAGEDGAIRQPRTIGVEGEQPGGDERQLEQQVHGERDDQAGPHRSPTHPVAPLAGRDGAGDARGSHVALVRALLEPGSCAHALDVVAVSVAAVDVAHGVPPRRQV